MYRRDRRLRCGGRGACAVGLGGMWKRPPTQAPAFCPKPRIVKPLCCAFAGPTKAADFMARPCPSTSKASAAQDAFAHLNRRPARRKDPSAALTPLCISLACMNPGTLSALRHTLAPSPDIIATGFSSAATSRSISAATAAESSRRAKTSARIRACHPADRDALLESIAKSVHSVSSTSSALP